MGYQPRDYGVPRRKVFGTAKLSGWRVPDDQDFEKGLRAVAAAAVQHALSLLVRRRLELLAERDGLTTQKVAADAGLSYSVFSKKLSGEVRMDVDDLVWMAKIGVAVPPPERLQEAALLAQESAIIARRHRPRPPIAGSHFDPGLSRQPVLPEDRLHPSHTAAAAALASMRRLAANYWSVDVDRLVRTDLRVLVDRSPDVDGTVLYDEVCARLWLPAGWNAERECSGVKATGDHFVAQVLEWDDDRPHRVLLLRVLPRPATAGHVPDDPIWALSPATLTADGFRWDEADDLAAAAAWDAY